MSNVYLKLSAALVVGFLCGLYFGPKKTEERVVYRDRIVKDEKRDVVTRTKETRLPNGTKITETIKEDKTVTRVDRRIDLDSVKKVESRPDWRVGVGYKSALPTQRESYSLQIERRIVGEIYVGATASTDRTVGVVISFGF